MLVLTQVTNLFVFSSAGASGYLGQHVLEALLHLATPSHIYAVFGKNQAFADAVSQYTNVTAVSVDLTDTDALNVWHAQHPPMNFCIHAAAMSSPRVCQQDPSKAKALNVPVPLFERLRDQKCQIIALSTDQVYAGDTNQLYVETDSAKPVNVYGQTKLLMEQVLENITHGDAVVLRSSIILGPLAPFASAHDTFIHFCAGREGQSTDFYNDECRSVVWVEDVVSAILWFVDNSSRGRGGIYNMGGPRPLSRVDMARAVFQHFGFDSISIVSKQKAGLSPGPVPSPLDISMDSSKLEDVIGRKFAGMDTILASTFPK